LIASVFSKGDNFPFYTNNQVNVLLIGISILAAIELSYPKLFKKIKYVVSFGEQD
tara:strand:+ start:138 stop:302 length:165 start_codon:yes stop_codon:yes gene_type:complete